jgi:autotransporter-associated beta strand protein
VIALKKFLYLFMNAALCLHLGAHVRAANMVVDSLTGPVTSNEINSFKNYMNARTPGSSNIDNEWVYNNSGTDTESLGLMYEVTRDTAILNRMLHFTDSALACRNDPTTGRVLFTGQRELAWPNKVIGAADEKYSGSENGDIIGHIAYASKLILQNPSLWNVAINDGDPHGYGATYLARAQKYITELDKSCDFLTANFVQNGKFYWPNTQAWRDLGYTNGGQAVPWNQQLMMFDNGFLRLAECHQLLGDNSPRIAQYKTLVQNSVNWFISDYTPHNYTHDGVTVYNWGYSLGRTREDTIHGNFDVIGMYRLYRNGSFGVTQSTMTGFANTTGNVIWDSVDNHCEGYIDGTSDASGSHAPRSYIPYWYVNLSEFQLSPDLYSIIANSDLSPGNMVATHPIYAANILWEKNKRYLSPDPSIFVWAGGIENNWEAPVNWIATTGVPDNKSVTAIFGNQSSTGNAVNLVTAGRKVGNITFTSTTSTTIQSALGYGLTLDNNGAASTINVAGNHAINVPVALNNAVNFSGAGTLNVSGNVSGSFGLNLLGGNLTLSGTNTYSGPTIITGGTLKAGSTNALGGTAGGTGINGGSLDINGQNLSNEAITVQGSGVGGNGAIVNTSSDQITALKIVTLSGDAVFGGSGRWDIRGTSATLSTGNHAYNLTKIGTNQVSFVAAAVDSALANIYIDAGILGFQTSTSSMGDASMTVAIASTGILNFWATSNSMNKKAVINGGTIWAESGAGTSNTFIGPITVNSGGVIFDAGGALTGGMPNSAVSMTLSGAIGGIGSVTKNGPGTVFITGTVAYNGDTTINEGTLQINTVGSPVLNAVSGAGTLGIGNGTASTNVTANSINIGAITIAAGSKLVIAARPGGPLADLLTPVPEPATFVLLTMGGLLILLYQCFKLFGPGKFAGLDPGSL